MKLARIRALIEQYETKLIDGSISDHELDTLLSTETFAQSPGDYESDLKLVGENYNTKDAIQIFTLKIVTNINTENLAQLIQRMVAKTPSNTNIPVFLQRTNLIKCFIASLRNAPHNDAAKFEEAKRLLIDRLNLQNNQELHQSLIKSIENQAHVLSEIQNKIAEQKAMTLDSISLAVKTKIIRFGADTLDTKSTIQPTHPVKKNENIVTHIQNKSSNPLKNVLLFTETNQRNILFISFLRNYAAHYNNPLVQMHQAIRNPDRRNDEGILHAKSKAAIAQEMIGYLNAQAFSYLSAKQPIQDSDIQEKFANLLVQEKMPAEKFFDASNAAIKLPEEIQKFLSPTTPYTSTNKATDATPTESKKHFGVFANMFGNKTTSSNKTQIAQLLELQNHYGSPAVQAKERADNFLSKNKKLTTTGLLQSVGKCNVAIALKGELFEENRNFKNRYLQALKDNGLDSDQFLSGKTKDFLSQEFMDELRSYAATCGNNL